jgi:hypothetical protein
MNNHLPSQSPESKAKVTPLRCLTGSLLSGSLGIALYSLTSAIATSFANKPIVSDKITVLKLSALVKTLVVGVASLGTFVFFFVAFGLLLLALQLTFQSLSVKSAQKDAKP